MRVAVFSTKRHDREFLDRANDGRHELVYLEPHLDVHTALLAQGCEAVCCFVNDDLSRPVLERLHGLGVRRVALRCAGYNNVDVRAAAELGFVVMRVPEYSPYAVAEHTFALILALDRKVHRAYNRVREGNFSIEGLMGFDLHGKTVGVVGTGRIGRTAVRIARGFGCDVVAYDPYPHDEVVAAGGRYVPLDELWATSDIITLHCPLTRDTFHMVDAAALDRMKPGAMLINTSRGALVDTPAVIDALRSGRLGAVGLDVYEEEADLFFEDLSDRGIPDDVLARLVTFPNVIVTAHQAFFTREAVTAIAQVTIANLDAMENGESTGREVTAELLVP